MTTTNTAIRSNDPTPRLLARLACWDDVQLAGMQDAIERTLAQTFSGFLGLFVAEGVERKGVTERRGTETTAICSH